MYRILLCDDDREIVSSLKIYLKAEGFQTECAYNGKKCLELLQAHEIHLVILDITMPGMSGIEVLSELRKWSNVPVIILSGKN